MSRMVFETTADTALDNGSEEDEDMDDESGGTPKVDDVPDKGFDKGDEEEQDGPSDGSLHISDAGSIKNPERAPDSNSDRVSTQDKDKSSDTCPMDVLCLGTDEELLPILDTESGMDLSDSPPTDGYIEFGVDGHFREYSQEDERYAYSQQDNISDDGQSWSQTSVGAAGASPVEPGHTDELWIRSVLCETGDDVVHV
ncbi:hypothetical protein T484DRAFT_1756660 [Baffinella frigidus]|nr:hypothetical protein T484DRAFT_1756660 [Cryptophyta sp. CCMP2293]